MAGALASLEALERTGSSQEVARSAEALREQVEKARSRHQVYGVVSTGWRFQTNANAAPDDAPLFLGADAPVLAASTPESDHSAFVDAALLYRFDPQRQDGRTIDTTLWFDGEKFLEVDEFDRAFARITAGPRFQVDPSRPDWTAWRPYLVGEILSFGGELYSVTPGAGLEISHKPRHDLVVSGEVEAAWRLHGSAAKVSFFDPVTPGDIDPGQTTRLPLRSPDDRDGLTVRTSFGAEWTPRPELLLAATPFLALRDARDDAVSAVDVGIQGSATLLVKSVRLAAPLQLSLVAQYRHAFYRDADRQVTDRPDDDVSGLPRFPEPFLKRRDEAVRVDLLAELPVTDSVSAFGGVGYVYTDSNIPNYSFDSFSTQLGLSWNF
jgi:hypothetical protein